MTHTPGPWRVTYNHTYGQFGTDEKVRDSRNSVICNLHVNSKANGLLIAAAPDMLLALKGIMASFHESVKTTESLADFPALQAVAQAITKAETGELTQ